MEYESADMIEFQKIKKELIKQYQKSPGQINLEQERLEEIQNLLVVKMKRDKASAGKILAEK